MVKGRHITKANFFFFFFTESISWTVPQKHQEARTHARTVFGCCDFLSNRKLCFSDHSSKQWLSTEIPATLHLQAEQQVLKHWFVKSQWLDLGHETVLINPDSKAPSVPISNGNGDADGVERGCTCLAREVLGSVPSLTFPPPVPPHTKAGLWRSVPL